MGNVKTGAAAGATTGLGLVFYWIVRAMLPPDQLGHLSPDEVSQAREVISAGVATLLGGLAGYAWALIRAKLPEVPPALLLAVLPLLAPAIAWADAGAGGRLLELELGQGAAFALVALLVGAVVWRLVDRRRERPLPRPRTTGRRGTSSGGAR